MYCKVSIHVYCKTYSVGGVSIYIHISYFILYYYYICHAVFSSSLRLSFVFGYTTPKNMLIFVLCILCKTATAQKAPDIKQVIRARLNAWEKGDFDALAKELDDLAM